MTPDRAHNQRRDGARRDADHEIDRLLDGGLSREQSQDLLRAIRADARACEDLARTRICVERLREPVAAPDLTDAILSRVHLRRRFLPQHGRRLVTVGRVAAAAGLVGAVALASFVQRHAPQVRLAAEPAPVTRFVEAAAPAARPSRRGSAKRSSRFRRRWRAGAGAEPLAARYRPEGQVHFDLSLVRRAERVTPVYTYGMPRAYAVGAPAASDDRSPASAETEFISRFGSLLVILREPPPAIDDSSADD